MLCEQKPMTSRDAVKKAIYFDYPHWLPMDMYISGPSDVLHAHGGEGSYRRVANERGERIDVDHFGCQFAVINNKTMGQPTNFPLRNIKKLDEYTFPDPRDEERLASIGGQISENVERYVTTSIIWFTFFERMHFIHGFQETLEDLYIERDLMDDFADRITDYNIAVIEALHERYPGQIHGIAMSDDWGSQSTTFVSLELFRDFFMPRYKRLFEAIRERGMDVWFHCCGYIVDFIPSFIEMGVQVLNLQQPKIFDLEELGGRFAGSICFNVPVDIQATMPSGSREEIRREARELVSCLATERGGIIANEHPDYTGNGIDPKKGRWAYEAFKDADPFQRRQL